jgi:hypothetical protein
LRSTDIAGPDAVPDGEPANPAYACRLYQYRTWTAEMRHTMHFDGHEAAPLVTRHRIGGIQQVLVIIVQNGIPHSERGVATSEATFFRSIGSSLGTAIFGAIFANLLAGNLASHLHRLALPSGFSSADVTPAALSHLPAAVHAGFVAGYAASIQNVFLIAVPIAALAFLATSLIPQVELRR